ncbi:MAG: carbohydrate kinase family protein [Anaerolineales bacterium]
MRTKPSAIILGRLQRETIITPQGVARIDQPGGELLYAAAAYRFWRKSPGLAARVGNDFPGDWVQALENDGYRTDGIRFLDEPHDLRSFVAYSDVNTAHRDNPIKHIAQLGMPFPKSLLGYRNPGTQLDSKKSRSPLTLRPEDLPKAYKGARLAHLCPLDYLSHTLVPPALRAIGAEFVSLEAGAGYMHPNFWNEFPALVNGLSVFFCEEGLLRSLFAGHSQDLWEMAEWVGSFNCQAVVILSTHLGQWIYLTERKNRYHIPAYPARLTDPTHAHSSFCGGFLAGWEKGGDVLYAALTGNVTASIAVEGSGPFYIVDSLPELAEARLESLQNAVQVV